MADRDPCGDPGPAGAAQGGFTLLELLVALVVLGLLVVGMTQGVRTGLAMRQAQTQRIGETADLDAAMRLLRSVLTRLPAIPPGSRLAAEPAFGFRGETDRISFIGDMPTGLGTTRRAAMTLYVSDRRLMLSWSPRRHEHALTPPQATDTELLHGVERLDLAYWGTSSADKPGWQMAGGQALPSQAPLSEAAGWQARWEGNDPPELIRVRLVFSGDDRRRWPDLIAASRP